MAILFSRDLSKIRQTTLDGISFVNHKFELYARYSYIGGIVLVLLVLMMSFRRRLPDAYCERGEYHQKGKQLDAAIADYENFPSMPPPLRTGVRAIPTIRCREL